MKVYIIDSVSKSKDAIELIAKKFEKMGHEVRYVKEQDGYLSRLIRDCFLTIESWADMVVVVPKACCPVLDIGDGTRYEMEHAKSFGKPVLIYYDL